MHLNPTSSQEGRGAIGFAGTRLPGKDVVQNTIQKPGKKGTAILKEPNTTPRP